MVPARSRASPMVIADTSVIAGRPPSASDTRTEACTVRGLGAVAGAV